MTATTAPADVETTDPTVDAETVWLVERRRPTDEPRRLVVVYATLDGARYVQTERRLGDGDHRETVPQVPVAERVATDRLERVADLETRARFAGEAQRMQALYSPEATR